MQPSSSLSAGTEVMKQQGINPFPQESQFIENTKCLMSLPVSKRPPLEDAACFRYEHHV